MLHLQQFHELCAAWPALTLMCLGIYMQNSEYFPAHDQRFSCKIFECSFGIKIWHTYLFHQLRRFAMVV